ncbi:glutamate racemase [Actinobaculum suis]|uniref:glutamate racemase n=1 Tax=Actinobaculum suis TaxID=1657 RepID=UPI00066FBF06|nr:glutamate racemase [Actinobaculum suis]KMY23513.1 glutamate racemase [Actinobaculum suis]
MDERPIGIFDSGVGGLTVARAILDQVPGEPVIYIGDTEHSPYGTKKISEVRHHALNVMEKLVASGVKMLVIACNSASSAALADARQRFEIDAGIPVIEVIRPAVRRAVKTTRNNKVGVIATQATIESGSYQDSFTAAPQIEVYTAACPLFVELVEAGITAGPQAQAVAEEYLAPLRTAGIDTLVLGCTHYPLLAGVISYTMGEDVAIVSSADETAKDVYRVLADRDLFAASSHPQHRFYATGDPHSFGVLAHRFLGPEVGIPLSTEELG